MKKNPFIEILIYISIIFIMFCMQVNAEEMSVHFLDVGQGLSICIESDGETLIYATLCVWLSGHTMLW